MKRIITLKYIHKYLANHKATWGHEYGDFSGRQRPAAKNWRARRKKNIKWLEAENNLLLFEIVN